MKPKNNKIKQELLNFILYKKSKCTVNNNLDLGVFYNKIRDDNLTVSDRKLLIENFLSNYLDFDANGEPIGNTLAIEAMIDYLVEYNNKKLY